MIFLTTLDDHAEPAPLRSTRPARRVPTIAEACGFAPRDYVPDPMDAPLGRLAYLVRDAPEAPTGIDAGPADWPESWGNAMGAAAMASVFVCDVLAPCDRRHGLTSPDGAMAPPLPRDQVEARLGNLRDGHARLDVLFGGACLQGSEANRLRRTLRDPERPDCLRPEPLADLRLGAHPATLAVKRALVDLHNALCEDHTVDDPCALTAALWHDCLRRDALPVLCGDQAGDGSITRAFIAAHPDGARHVLPLEAALGPFSLLVPMLLAPSEPRRALAALTLQIQRCIRHNLPGPAALLDAFGLPAPDIPENQTLPAFLVAEARGGPTALGPLGARLLSDAIIALIESEYGVAAHCPNDRCARQFATLRNLSHRTARMFQ